MAEFFKQNATAVIGFLGVLLGALVTGSISLATAWVMRDRDFKLKAWEKILDRRHAAHETVLTLAHDMRLTVLLGAFDNTGEVVRCPKALMSKDDFDEWFTGFSTEALPASSWLSTPVKRELYFIQDYLTTLNMNLSNVLSELYPQVGNLLREDFIDLSSNLEKLAFEYFEAEATKRILNDLNEHHKYPREEAERRLNASALFQKWHDVRSLVQEHGPSLTSTSLLDMPHEDRG